MVTIRASAGRIAGANIRVWRAGVEVDRVARLKRAVMVAMVQVELTVEHVEELVAGVHVRRWAPDALFREG